MIIKTNKIENLNYIKDQIYTKPIQKNYHKKKTQK